MARRVLGYLLGNDPCGASGPTCLLGIGFFGPHMRYSKGGCASRNDFLDLMFLNHVVTLGHSSKTESKLRYSIRSSRGAMLTSANE